MGGKRVNAARDRPDVEIVNLGDTLDAIHQLTDRIDIDVRRNGLQQDIDCIPNEAVSACNDDYRDSSRDDRVRPEPARQCHDSGTDQDAH